MGRPANTLEKVLDKNIGTIRPRDTCWVWKGPIRNYYGYKYPVASLAGKVVYVKRAVFELHIGPAPEKLRNQPWCGNALCINPWHLPIVSWATDAFETEPAIMPKPVIDIPDVEPMTLDDLMAIFDGLPDDQHTPDMARRLGFDEETIAQAFP